MADDLVTRLKKQTVSDSEAYEIFSIMREAAAEITRLKAVIAAFKEVAAELDKEGHWQAASRIRVALNNQKGEGHDHP